MEHFAFDLLHEGDLTGVGSGGKVVVNFVLNSGGGFGETGEDEFVSSGEFGDVEDGFEHFCCE